MSKKKTTTTNAAINTCCECSNGLSFVNGMVVCCFKCGACVCSDCWDTKIDGGPNAPDICPSCKKVSFAINIKQIKKRVKLGDAWAMTRLGESHLIGDGVKLSNSIALNLFKQASELDHHSASYHIWRFFLTLKLRTGTLNNMEVLSKTQKEGHREVDFLLYLKRAAKGGHMHAQCELGKNYESKSKLRKAAKWYALAYEQGQAEAAYLLGAMFEGGRGVELSIPKAIELYQHSFALSTQNRTYDTNSGWLAEQASRRFNHLGKKSTKMTSTKMTSMDEISNSTTEKPATLRFAVGQRIEANVGQSEFLTGVVVQHHYIDSECVQHPYQILVDSDQRHEGMKYIFARWDEDCVVRKLSQSNKDQEYKACLLCDMTELNGKKLVKCGRCQTSRYCNKICQRNHWKEHKKNCKKK